MFNTQWNDGESQFGVFYISGRCAVLILLKRLKSV